MNIRIVTAVVLINRGFRYRIYPTADQAARLERWEGALRFLWNLANEQRRQGFAKPRGYRKFYSAFDQINQLTELRAELSWLADVPRDVSNQLLIELDKAWQRWLKGLCDEPRYKSKSKRRGAAPICGPNSKSFSVENGIVTFPKLGRIRAVLHRPLDGKPKTCSIVRDGDQWFASVCCEQAIADPVPSTKPPIAIDRGVVNIIADSDGRIVPAPRSFERARKKLARAQRVVCRRQKGSKNQQKARARVARIHRKARRQREAVLHRESRRYAKNHGVIVVERLNIRGMTRSARGTVEDPGTNVRQKAGLNRGIHDAGWGNLVTMTRYKTIPEGSRVEDVSAVNSSIECAACHHAAKENRPTQSEFHCVACGHRDHADVNAAKVLLSRRTGGSAVCGGSAVGRPPKQKLRVVKRGTQPKGCDAPDGAAAKMSG